MAGKAIPIDMKIKGSSPLDLDVRDLPSVVSARLVRLRTLKCHEMLSDRHLFELRRRIASDGVIKRPIVVDANTRIILDGHHRYGSLRDLDLDLMPVIFVDYSSSDIRVDSWRGVSVRKADVLRAGTSGRLMPPKTSRHIVPFDVERVDLPLPQLRLPLRGEKRDI